MYTRDQITCLCGSGYRISYYRRVMDNTSICAICAFLLLYTVCYMQALFCSVLFFLLYKRPISFISLPVCPWDFLFVSLFPMEVWLGTLGLVYLLIFPIKGYRGFCYNQVLSYHPGSFPLVYVCILAKANVFVFVLSLFLLDLVTMAQLSCLLQVQ